MANGKNCNKISSAMFSPKTVLILLGVISRGIAEIGSGLGTKSSDCILPTAWKGEWYQNEFPSDPVTIDDTSISRGNQGEDNIGNCLKQVGLNYIFKNHHNCTRCLFIHSFHENVLNYKESDCAEDNHVGGSGHNPELIDLQCQHIRHDSTQYLFKIDSKPIDCPFQDGPYNFSYMSGGDSQVCHDPPSTVAPCMDKSQLLVGYQGCHDHKSQGSQQEITCIGNWKEGGLNFLAAKVGFHKPGGDASPIDRLYRCFVYEQLKVKVKEGDPLINTDFKYKVSISGSATCAGLDSTSVGDKVLNLYKDVYEKLCQFPHWFTSKTWHTLDHHLIFQTYSEDTSVFVNLEKALNKSGSHGAKMTCWKSKDDGNQEVTLIAKAAQGCHVQNICVKLSPKTDFIARVQIAEQPQSQGDNEFISHCFNTTNATSALTFTPITLISDRETRISCTHPGLFHLNEYMKDDKFAHKSCGSMDRLEGLPKEVKIGCKSGQTKMEFQNDDCENNEVEEEASGTIVAECVDTWQEDDKEYLLASFSNEGKSDPMIYCFQIYNDTDHFAVSGQSRTCPMGFQPDSDSLSFKLIPQGSCPEDSANVLQMGSGASHLRLQAFASFACFCATVLLLPHLIG